MKARRTRTRINPTTIQLIKQILVGVLVLGLVAGMVTGVWYVSRLPALTIVSVSVSGGETIPHERVKTVVKQELEGSYLGLVPKRFSLLYPKTAIASAVMAVERVRSVEIDRDSLTGLTVTFNEYIPDTLWCAEDTCVFVDREGYAFTPAPLLQGGAFLRLEKIGVTPTPGVHAFSASIYNAAKELVRLLEEQDWYVAHVAIDQVGDAYLTLTAGGELKVSLRDDPPQIIDNLFTVIQSAEFSGLEPGNFAYIDLRFGNKVFVSEEGLATSTSAIPTTTSSVSIE